MPAVITCSTKLKRGISENDYLRKTKGVNLTLFTVNFIQSFTPGILESPVNIWCRLIEGMQLRLNEICYEKPTNRSIILADVLAITGDIEYISSVATLDRLNSQKLLLLSYDAGIYGETATLDKQIKTDYNYNELLKKLSEVTDEREQ